jgi:hypothetical protein
MDYAIRPADVDDKTELARLFTVLGHPCSASDIAARWDAWRAEGTVALVAQSACCTRRCRSAASPRW